MSAEFKAFLANDGIHHITSATYHRSMNGLVEKAVQTMKRALKEATGGTLKTRVSPFPGSLPLYTTTGMCPAEIMFGTYWNGWPPTGKALNTSDCWRLIACLGQELLRE